MVLKLYAFDHSTHAKAVAMALIEKGVPFEVVTVDLLKGENHKPEFLAKNPYGNVPYLVSYPHTNHVRTSHRLNGGR
jgi:glutathione S-transferase